MMTTSHQAEYHTVWWEEPEPFYQLQDVDVVELDNTYAYGMSSDSSSSGSPPPEQSHLATGQFPPCLEHSLVSQCVVAEPDHNTDDLTPVLKDLTPQEVSEVLDPLEPTSGGAFSLPVTCRWDAGPYHPQPENRPPRKTRQKRRRRQKDLLLWQFLVVLLVNPEHNPHCIRWLDRDQGIFTFTNTKRIGELWGKRKSKKNMSYEYLSRAIRHYYKDDIMIRVQGRRLVYRFLEGATNWRQAVNCPSPSTAEALLHNCHLV